MTPDEKRAAFEASWRLHAGEPDGSADFSRGLDGEYLDPTTQEAWRRWLERG